MVLKMFFIMFYSEFVQMISCVSLYTARKKENIFSLICVSNHGLSPREGSEYNSEWLNTWTSETKGHTFHAGSVL